MPHFLKLHLNPLERRIFQIVGAMTWSTLMVIIGLQLHNPQKSAFNEANYLQFDAAHYLTIAENGYECFSCLERFGGNWNKNDWCGNAGWFPGYPLTIRIANVFVKDYKTSAVLLNQIFILGMALLIFRLMELQGTKQRFLSLLTSLVVPGFIYFFAIFPMAGTMFFILLAFYSYLTRNNTLLFITVFLSTIYYPTGAFVIVPIIITSIILAKDNLRKIIWDNTILCIAVLLGLLFVCGVMYADTHYYDAYFKVSSKYNNHFHLPFIQMWRQVMGIFDPSNTSITKNIQSSICIFGIILIVILNFVRFIQHKLNPLEMLSTIYLLIFLFLPWSLAGDFSSYRSESLLLPFIFSNSKFDNKVLFVLFIVFSLLGIFLGFDFFSGKIV